MTKIPGKFVSCPGNYQAYIPNKLPPETTWNTKLAVALSEADYALGKLAGYAGAAASTRPFLTREALLSSQIEGTQASLSDVLASGAGAINLHTNPDDLQEVTNYINALDYGIQRLPSLPLSLRLLREIHAKLMVGVRGEHATPGEFRRSQNWIGVGGSTITTATYIPPSPDYLMECLGALENFLHTRNLPPLMQIALVHYQFEAIHPFLDGNGRIGRLLITLFLIERGTLPTPLLYLSAFFEATRAEYYARLLAVTKQGDWEGWLHYFLYGVARQAEDALSRITRLNTILNGWRNLLSTKNNELPLKLIAALAVNPYLTITQSATTFGVSYTTMQRAIEKLQAHNIVQETSQGKRNRVYCARELLIILEEPAKIRS